MPRMQFFFKKDEYKEMMLEREREADQLTNKSLEKIDIRRVSSFGDAYSAETYRRANEILPNKLDNKGRAVDKMARLAQTWRPQSEIRYHVWGAYALGGLTSVTAMYITGHFRHYLRLGRYARLVMYSASTIFPAVACHIGNQFMSNMQIPLRGERCTTCVAVKNALIQSLVSVVYPSFFTCLMGFYYAQAYHTIPAVPPSFMYKKDQAAHVGKLIKSIAERGYFPQIVMLLFLANLFAAYHIAERQQQDTLLMFKKVLDKQEMIVQANRGAAVVDSFR